MTDTSGLTSALIWWVVLTALVVGIRLRQRADVAYLLNLWASHWLGALLYALPWWRAMDVSGLIETGFQQATYGLLGAVVGSLLVGPFVMTAFGIPPAPRTLTTPVPRLATSYLTIGIVAHFIVMPLVRNVPTAAAFASAGWRLLVVGLALTLWRTWHARQRGPFVLSLCIALGGLPLLTVAQAGFLSYGSSAALTLLVFAATFVHLRWKAVVTAALIGYAGLSFCVTYMRDRTAIRSVVWEESSVTERAAPIWQTLTTWEWLDLKNDDHLKRIDERLNQNFLVGSAAQYLGTGMADFARGATIREALLALIPRVFWPEKPIEAGSGSLVSEYTGITFAEGTSVGIGQIMEFYVNFGAAGVIIGCLVLGTLLAICDSAAGQRLRAGDWQGFAYWYLPGLSLLNVEGSLVETISGTAVAFIVATLVNRYLLRRFRGRAASSGSDSPSRA